MSEQFTVELPSAGHLYDGKLPGGKVDLHPMGANEEALIFQRGGDPQTKISRIVDNCYLDAAKVKADDLLTIDRFYILFMLRMQMFGAVYTIPFKCQFCNHQRKIQINLMEDLDKTTMDACVEPFEATLPHIEKIVEFRLLRGKDEADVNRHSKRMMMKSVDAGDPSYRYRLGKQIMTVGGEDMAPEKAYDFAKSLDMRDANEFRLAVETVEGGIDLTLFKDCAACGSTNEFTMPFTAEFLLPSERVD